MDEQPPRIPPGTRRDTGTLNFLIASAIGRAAGSGPPNVMTTLGRHRRLFRRWLRFAGALMPGGSLPRTESELLILRCAHNCGSAYEWEHHRRIGRQEGLTTDEIERVKEGPYAAGWTPRQAALLRAADELHRDRMISSECWESLSGELSDEQLIEVCMLVGHYEMLAMTLNSAGTPLDSFRSSTGPDWTRTLRRLLGRRR